MIRLAKPDVDVDAYITQIVTERQGGVNASFFSGIEPTWKARCRAYDAAGGDGAQLPTWAAAKDKAGSFRNLYSSPKPEAAQTSYIQSLRNRTLQLCPMCGEAGTPNTLDHFLPQERYPEFSILPYNLVPACDICQGHKATKVVDSQGRLFLHPYYDGCLHDQVVRLRIIPPYSSPSPELLCHPCVPSSDRELVQRHLKELGLQPRFFAFFKRDYLRLLRLVQRTRNRGQDVVGTVTQFLEHAADRSVNSWEHVLYEGALSDPDVTEYLEEGPLPAFL